MNRKKTGLCLNKKKEVRTLEDIIRRMPKIDLHCHLDGSLTLESVRKITGREVAPEELQAEERCRDLAEYLKKFDIPIACLKTAEALKTAARDFLLDAAKEHICYMETRFAPLHSAGEGLDAAGAVEAVLEGLKEAEEICHVRWGLIVCAMRHHSQEDNLAMLKACRAYLGEGVCAADLAGDEASFPMKNYMKLFQEARKLDYPFTIHAGECGNAENIRDAVECGASRIGHGIAMSGRPDIQRLCREKRIGIEMCPVSNIQTRAASSPESYPLREFMEAGLMVTLNTDNRTVSRTSIAREMEFARTYCGVTEEELAALERNAVDVLFADDGVKHELWKLWN